MQLQPPDTPEGDADGRRGGLSTRRSDNTRADHLCQRAAASSLRRTEMWCSACGVTSRLADEDTEEDLSSHVAGMHRLNISQ